VLRASSHTRPWHVDFLYRLCHLDCFSLVPVILLTESNETSTGDDPINTSQYISDFTEILIESTSDGEIGRKPNCCHLRCRVLIHTTCSCQNHFPKFYVITFVTSIASYSCSEVIQIRRFMFSVIMHVVT